MKLITAFLAAALAPAATITFTQASATLPGGETITIGTASATFSALPASIIVPVSADTSVNGSGVTNFAIDVPWDVDGVAATL